MKKVLNVTLGFALATVLVGALTLLATPAPEAEAFSCITCRCAFQVRETAIGSADGSTCAAAKGNLYSQLAASTGCQSFCLEELIITMECTPNGGGGYWVMGKLSYQCEICIDKCM